MNEITIQSLTPDNFSERSLDSFIRRQTVTERWVNKDGALRLEPDCFTEDWDIGLRREIAGRMLNNLRRGFIGLGAFDGSTLIGWTFFGNELCGSRGNYIELDMFHVSEPYRGKGVGRKLFTASLPYVRKTGAEKIFISAHSSKESQAAYKALGCVPAQEFFPQAAKEEPCDIQLEYDLTQIT